MARSYSDHGTRGQTTGHTWMTRDFKIRNFHSSDAAACLELYRDTIRRVNCDHYSPEQINAWA